MESLHDEYQRRLEQRRKAALRLDREHYAVGFARLGLFVAIVLSLGAVIGHTLPATEWLLLPFAAFAALLIWHSRLAERWAIARRAEQYYQAALDRLNGAWAGRGTAGSDFLSAQHPYARDLDLFGKGSLFELLCRARTRAGEERLALWLQQGASPAEIEQRQEKVRDLIPRLDLREELATLNSSRSSLGAEAMNRWTLEPERLTSRPLRLVAALVGILGVASLAYWVASWNIVPLLGMLVLVQGVRTWAGADLHRSVEAAEPLRSECESLTFLLGRLQRETFRQPLFAGNPGEALAHLHRLLDALESRRNYFLAPLLHVALLPLQLAASVESWRRRHGAELRAWIEALAEFEAANSLATFAAEHPDYAWPEFLPPGEGLSATGLGHPLLGPCVGNDVDLRQHPLWIVSGSNMAGKSSLLRALGTNVVLAMAGAPVRARSLQLEPLRVGASIQLHDSLQAGISRFYAEILRLRQLHEMAGGEPRLLFLLDEIMAGTNSHDRRIGAEAVVRSLVARGALGLVTTHDLALTGMADGMNVHFEDHLEDGKIHFDYRLRPGPVTRSNALELMRSVGLEV